ncbi:MAG: DUF488 family protein [Lysobacteraceae bacterium]
MLMPLPDLGFKTTAGGAHASRTIMLAELGLLLDACPEAASQADYARQFMSLMRERRIEKLDRAGLDGACLLCSEDKPHACHRRLVAEYLGEAWEGVQIEHL